MRKLNLIILVFGFGLVSGVLADDSAECGKKGEIVFTVLNEGYSLRTHGREFKVNPKVIKAKNRTGQETIEEEYIISVDNGTSVKTEYLLQNWRNCGNVDNVRVRIYQAYPDRKVFVKELSCNCQNS
jgi:hypothetical protein